jgi:hypothetical protein
MRRVVDGTIFVAMWCAALATIVALAVIFWVGLGVLP